MYIRIEIFIWSNINLFIVQRSESWRKSEKFSRELKVTRRSRRLTEVTSRF
mgnify:CR=1 FL=1